VTLSSFFSISPEEGVQDAIAHNEGLDANWVPPDSSGVIGQSEVLCQRWPPSRVLKKSLQIHSMIG
jgi:hypothetical protein